MNKENLLRVADAIEKHEIAWLGFNMSGMVGELKDRSKHGCGATACIAGWATAVAFLGIDYAILLDQDHEGVALKFLGLDCEQGSDLFYEGPSNTHFSLVTPEQAVCTLRYAAEHGVIDWDAANPGAAP